MKITNHLLDTAQKQIIPGGSGMGTRRFLVIHYTAGMSAQSSIDWWRNPDSRGASAHIVIDRDGTIYQCRPFDRTAGHAGVSAWRDPKTGYLYNGLNACSIGIELANAGDCVNNGKLFGKYPALNGTAQAAHKWEPRTMKAWEEYGGRQLAACAELAKLLVATYHLDDVVGHEDIAPPGLRKHGDWKPDPGPLFPMKELRQQCGFTAPTARLFQP